MPPSTSISPSTQSRILIWRTEVASAVDAATSSAASSDGILSAPSLAATTTTTTTTSSSSAVASTLSRGRRIWNRISRRLSGRSSDSGAPGDISDLLQQPARRDEPVIRTAMYRMAAQGATTAVAAAENEDMVLGEGSSRGRGRGGLLETQDRLQRAARLLNQGAS